VKCEKIIKKNIVKTLIFITLGIVFVSCNSNQGNIDLKENPRTSNESLKSDVAVSPSKTVEMFMKLVEQNKLDEAMNLFVKEENNKADGAKNNSDKPSTFNWAKSLNERNLSLKKVLDEKIKDSQAFVNAELYTKDLPNVVTVSEFQLIKRNNDWKLSDIKLVKNQ
jgi:hypothetical protein